MILEGVIIGGRVELNTPTELPDGTRVRVELVTDDDWESLEPPSEPYDREKELAILREAHEESKAGIGVRPLEEFMAEMTKKYNFPPVRSE
jgi:hypothetical protein